MKRWIALLLALALCAMCAGGAAEESIDSLIQRANAGDAAAMLEVGMRYYRGRGVAEDDAIAAYWFYKAAEAGSPEGMHRVGVMFYYGYGTDQNRDAAMTWFQRSADAGYREALFFMGINSRDGTNGVTRSAQKAQQLLYQAAEAGFEPRGALYYYQWEMPSAASFDSVLQQANNGNTAAMCDLGYMYDYGQGTEENQALAAYWWYMAADAGVPLAMYCSAYMFINGLGTARNTAEGQRWIKKLVEQGKRGLASEYARNYTEKAAAAPAATAVPTPVPTPVPTAVPTPVPTPGVITEQPLSDDMLADAGDPEAMMRVYGLEGLIEAALRGDLDAAYALGYCYYYGIGVTRSEEESFNWFLRVAEEGVPPAYMWVADAYYYGRGVAQDYEEAAEWYREAAEEGIARAMYMLGLMYKNGEGVKQDDRKADKWFGRAEEEGYTAPEQPTAVPAIDIDAGRPEEMMSLLGLDRLMEAAAQGDLDAAYIIAWCYANGVGVPQDDQQAFAWFLFLAQQGDPRAYSWVADAYAAGRGVDQDLAEAIRWYQAAMEENETGIPESNQQTGAPVAAADNLVPDQEDLDSVDIDAGRPEEMMNLLGLDTLVDAATRGDLDAAYIIAWCYANGKGVEQNDALAFEWFHMLAAEEGDPRAYIWVGNYYYRGAGTNQDYAEAVKWYMLAAEEGDMIALGNAADVYNYGRGNVAQDLPRAFALYKQSAEGGNVTSMGNLGVCYLNGRGTDKNTEQGVYWITRAAEAGNAAAMYNLGQMYEKGVGVAKDAAAARGWYEKAAAAGNSAAQQKIGK